MARNSERIPLPALLFLLAAALFAALATLIGRVLLPRLDRIEQRLQALEESAARTEGVLALLRFRKDPSKEDLSQVLAALSFWCGELERRGSSLIERQAIEERLAACRRAFEAAGRSAGPALVTAFREVESGRLEYRRRILELLRDLAPAAAEALAAEVLTTQAYPSNLRVAAARILKSLDAERAGRMLAKILVSESRLGLRHPMPGGASPVGRRPFPGFFDLIPVFLETPYRQKADVLLLLLDQPEHGIATLNEVLKALEALRAKAAVPRLKELFHSRRIELQNPLFRMNVARVIAALAGKGACSWFETQILREQDVMVLERLRQLFTRYCG